jgi:ribosomal protein S18 acetylase RimI-like enzyme
MLGVDPSFQSRGHGSALLRETLKLCDEDGLTAYLESSNPRTIPLYERHGFKHTGIIRAPDAPCLYPMVRLPQS